MKRGRGLLGCFGRRSCNVEFHEAPPYYGSEEYKQDDKYDNNYDDKSDHEEDQIKEDLKKLGILSIDSDKDIIKKAYKKLALTQHPDKRGDKQQFVKLTEAYERLQNLDLKKIKSVLKNNIIKESDESDESDESTAKKNEIKSYESYFNLDIKHEDLIEYSILLHEYENELKDIGINLTKKDVRLLLKRIEDIMEDNDVENIEKFLRKNPRIKEAYDYAIEKEIEKEGILDTPRVRKIVQVL